MPNATIESVLRSQTEEELIPQLETLLSSLQSTTSRINAVAMLHSLASEIEKQTLPNLLSLHTVQVPGLEKPIRLFLTPAVFSPEYWGKTFAEGLLKEPDIFNGKRVVELGTGSGWISLVLLQRTEVREVLGLDINPVAILTANLNKWLNGTTCDGTLLLTPAGLPLVDSFRAEVSDLLAAALSTNTRYDHIVGCIPQVLHPDQGKASDTKLLSTQDLYDLSNYCFQQGILEDRFGLPLIARALEEAQICLNPDGLLTLILGGRPGTEAIEEMFRRRGYVPDRWWTRRIPQADDTDLAQLVSLEDQHNISFHFFLSGSSRQSIPASTAVMLQQRGHKIFHDLLVYRARTKFEKPTLGFVRGLHKLELEDVRKELDFSRCDEEQISFLNRLTDSLLTSRTLPYPHERGDLQFREKLSRFLQVYCHFPSSPETLFIGPQRSVMVAMILKLVANPGAKILLSASLDQLYAPAIEQLGLDCIRGNDDLAELLEMDEVFRPTVSVLAPFQLNDASPLLLNTLITQARNNPNRWYLIDDSNHFDIGSHIYSNRMLRLPDMQNLPPNLIFLYGLIKNVVCPDFELSFLINTPSAWIEGLEIAAELTYSRISCVVQLYYDWLFNDLLSFPFAETDLPASDSAGDTTEDVSRHPFTDQFKSVATDPVFAPKPVSPDTDGLIRLDYGEFEYPAPDLVLRGLIKAFLETRSEGLASVLCSRINAYLVKTRHAEFDPACIVPAEGVFPLFGALIKTLKHQLGRTPRVAIPRGSYGPVFPCLAYHGAEVILLEDTAQSFVLSIEQLERAPAHDLLWLTQPANPSGIFLEPSHIRKIMRHCVERQVYVFSDEIFFLLSDLALGSWTPADLSFGYGLTATERRYLFFADGLSKAFASGGLRCGFMVCPNRQTARIMSEYVTPPPQPILRAWDNLYSAFLEKSPHNLLDVERELHGVESYLKNARQQLSEHRDRLLNLLDGSCLSDGEKFARRGGLFLLAKLGSLADELANEQKLLINSAQWSRTPGWCRLCFSITPRKFDIAMKRLEAFISKEC